MLVYLCVFLAAQNKFHNALSIWSGLVCFLCLFLIWKVCVCKISGGLTMVDWHEWVTETESRSQKVPCSWNSASAVMTSPCSSRSLCLDKINIYFISSPLFLSLQLPVFRLFPGLSICFVRLCIWQFEVSGGNRVISVRRSWPDLCVLMYILTQNFREAVIKASGLPVLSWREAERSVIMG